MDNSKYTLLLIEDEESLRLVYKEYFEMEGFKIIEAKDGEEALEAITAHRKDIDMVLLDLMLPKIDGIKVLEKIKTHPDTKNIKVYLMTVLGRDQLIKKAFALGADGYIVKDTLTPEQIKDEIVAVLKKK